MPDFLKKWLPTKLRGFHHISPYFTAVSQEEHGDFTHGKGCWGMVFLQNKHQGRHKIWIHHREHTM